MSCPDLSGDALLIPFLSVSDSSEIRLEEISFAATTTGFRCSVTSTVKHGLIDIDDLSSLEKALRRWAPIVYVKKISIGIYCEMTQKLSSVIDALFQFRADRLEKKFTPICDLSLVTRQTLFTFAQNLRKISINFVCSSLKAIDLCKFRKSLLEGEYKLESFAILINEEVVTAFLKTCFGVTVEEESDPEGFLSKKICCSDKELQLYTATRIPSDLSNFTGNLQTHLSGNGIKFEKLKEGEEDDLVRGLKIVELNYRYVNSCPELADLQTSLSKLSM